MSGGDFQSLPNNPDDALEMINTRKHASQTEGVLLQRFQHLVGKDNPTEDTTKLDCGKCSSISRV